MNLLYFLSIFVSLTSLKPPNEINYQGLYNEILEQGLEFPEIVFAQAILESGHFKSEVFHQNNNLFGMKQPSKRNTVSNGKSKGYAIYDFWQDSVEDYYLYQEFMFKNKKITKNQYLNLLDRTYSTTSGYSKKLLKIIKNFQDVLYEPPADRNDGDLFNNSNP